MCQNKTKMANFSRFKTLVYFVAVTKAGNLAPSRGRRESERRLTLSPATTPNGPHHLSLSNLDYLSYRPSDSRKTGHRKTGHQKLGTATFGHCAMWALGNLGTATSRHCAIWALLHPGTDTFGNCYI